MQVRPAEPDDYPGIDAVLKSAFPTASEARLVAALRAAEADTLELVAEDHGQIVATALFSPVEAEIAGSEPLYGLGLAPVAVLPGRQRQGIGQAVVEAGLDFVRTLGAPFCVVLGEPAYYGRFGFEPAARSDWTWSADPEGKTGDAFQVQGLQGKTTSLPAPAVAHYHPAFDGV